MSALLDKLCDYFDGEIERQENVLLVCRAQAEAAHALDFGVLDKRNEALANLLSEAVQDESERLAIVAELAEHLPASKQSLSLSDVVRLVPEPWSHRLRHDQEKLRAIVNETRVVLTMNTSRMRKSLRIVTTSIDRVLGPESGQSYTDTGTLPGGEARRPALLNTRG